MSEDRPAATPPGWPEEFLEDSLDVFGTLLDEMAQSRHERDVKVTDCRENPEPCGFGGVKVETEGYTALLPPWRTGVSVEQLDRIAAAVRRRSAGAPIQADLCLAEPDQELDFPGWGKAEQ